MPAPGPLVRLFVSSTFLDFEAERNALHTRVFPRIRASCAARGLRFQPIDLRWGISDAAAADQLTLPLCLEEIARCQRARSRPNFLALIGDRYGWRPPPPAIPAVEFDRVVGAIADASDAALARDWYRRDENALPAEYRLIPRAGVWRDADRWRSVEAVLTKTLREAARRRGLDADARLKYEASATEQEIARAVLGPEGDPGACVCVVRRFVDVPALVAESWRDRDDDTTEAEDRRRAMIDRLEHVCGDRLQQYLVPWSDTTARAAYLDRFCDEVGAALERATFEDEARERDGDGPRRERAAHAAFAAERRAGFVGRVQELTTVVSSVEARPPHPMLIMGPSGSGKSAFMARLEAELRTRPSVRVVARFAGATPLCSTWPGLVASLLSELRPPDADAPRQHGAAESADAMLARVLRTWSPSERLVLLIDALDQLGTSAPHLDPDAGWSEVSTKLAWLPRPLPDHVQVVLSVTADRSASFETLTPEAGRVQIGGLGRTDSGTLLQAWLADARRTIQPAQRDAVLSAPDSGLPLYLRLAADACVSWTSDDEPEALAPDLAGLIRQRLDRLVAPDMHGQAFVSRALGYLACSRAGLAEDEILDLLSGDSAVHEELARTAHHALPDGRVPVVLWARLYQDLLATLTQRMVDGDSVLAFYHRQLEAGVRERFVGEDARRGLHARLADHFEHSSGARALAELPYQLASSGRWASFRETMSDVEYLIARSRAHGTTLVIHDFGLGALAGAPPDADDAALDQIRRAFELSAHAIEDDPAQLRTHLLARLPATTEGPIGRLRGQIESSSAAWIAPLRVSLASADSPLVRSMTAEAHTLVLMAGDAAGRALVTGDDEGVLRVWGVRSGALRRTLGRPGPGLAWLRAGPDLRAVAAGYRDGRARLWDLEAGVVADEIATATADPLALSSDGHLLALAPGDGGLIWWDLASAGVAGRRRLLGSPLAVGCFTRDGRACAVANSEGEVLVVPVGQPEGQPVGAPTPWKSKAEVTALFPAADNQAVVVVLAASKDKYTSDKEIRVLILDARTSEVRWRVPQVLEAVWCAPDGTTAVGRAPVERPDGIPERQLLAFDLQAHERRWDRQDGHTMTSILTWSPSGEHALTLELEFEEIHYSSEVRHRIGWMDMLSGARTGPAVAQVEANHGFLHVLPGEAGPLGAWCIVEDTLHFTATGGSTLQPIITPGSRIIGAVSAEGGRRVATASSDGVIRVWNPMAAGDQKAMAPAPIRAVARSTNRDVVVVRSNAIQQMNVESWSTRSNRESGPALLSSELASATISPNGGWVAYLERNTIGISHQEMYLWPTEQLVLWNTAKATQAAAFSTKFAGGSQLECSHLAVADDGSRVVLGVERPETGGAAVVVWAPAAGHDLTEIEARPVRLCALALAPDGLTLATGWDDGAIAVSTLEDRSFPAVHSNAVVGTRATPKARRAHHLTSVGAPVRVLAWSPDARFLAWACDDGTISIASVSPGASASLRTSTLHRGCRGARPAGREKRGAGLGGAVAQFQGDAARLAFSPDSSHLLAIGARLAWHRVPDGIVSASLTLDAPFVDAAFLDASVVVAGDRMGDLHLLALREGAPAAG